MKRGRVPEFRACWTGATAGRRLVRLRAVPVEPPPQPFLPTGDISFCSRIGRSAVASRTALVGFRKFMSNANLRAYPGSP